MTTAAIAVAPAAATASTAASGDWEAHTHAGALASFELQRGRVSDLVVQAPISCQNAFSTPLPIDVEIVPGSLKLNRAGGFSSTHAGTTVRASYAHGRFNLSYRHVARTRNAYEGGTQVCDTKTVDLTATRGHRRQLKDGIWQGQSAQQEPVQLNVVAGGRALETPLGTTPSGSKAFSFQLTSSGGADPCAYEIAYPLLIGADGSFSNDATRLGDEAVVSGRFTGARKVKGKFSNLEESCGLESWSAALSRIK